MRRALLRCALALASLPAARSEGGGVDGLISNVIDTATPGLQKAVDLAPGININQADMDRFKAEKGKVDAVTRRRVEPAVGGDDEAARRGRRGRG